MTASVDPLAVFAGLGFGLSLIVAIGAQNAFVLRQGLLRRHVGAVVAVCAISDIVLIALGIGGLGAVFQQAPVLMTVARIGGAAFLVGYGALAARRAIRPGALVASAPEPGTASSPGTSHTPAAAISPDTPSSPGTSHGPRGARLAGSLTAAVTTCLALTWLNPHVYLDTVVLLGSVANSHGDSRWIFGAGAALGSVLWFTALGYGARLLQPVFARPMAWRVLDGVIAAVMIAIAVTLLIGL
ncbi:LysE/ArgO family amino acid transporter [Herbiconiux sp. P18]|uniref:LysE/ArgO family amino acid transporter n=1 Tax=Herbiconiux liangxiaofengii TaxID=3342795 RepID=UPI0035B722B7